MAINKKDAKFLELFHSLPELEQNSTLDFMEYLSSKIKEDKWFADNSPLTEQEEKAIEESIKEIEQNEVVNWEDIKREFDL